MKATRTNTTLDMSSKLFGCSTQLTDILYRGIWRKGNIRGNFGGALQRLAGRTSLSRYIRAHLQVYWRIVLLRYLSLGYFRLNRQFPRDT